MAIMDWVFQPSPAKAYPVYVDWLPSPIGSCTPAVRTLVSVGGIEAMVFSTGFATKASRFPFSLFYLAFLPSSGHS